MANDRQVASRNAGSFLAVSTASQSLLSKAGYKPPNPEREALATAAIAILFGSYTRDNVASAEILRESMVAMLAAYPEDCIRGVTDPRTGIQSFGYAVFDHIGREVRGKFKSFPPNVGELQEACEKYMLPIRSAQERERRITAQAREAAAEAERREAAAPGMAKAIAEWRSTTPLEELVREAVRIAQFDTRTPAQRVQDDLAQRKAARAP